MKPLFKFSLILISFISLFFISTVSGQFLYDDETVPILLPDVAATITNIISNVTFNQTLTDIRYWCLNQTLCGGKTPVEDWDMGDFGFDNLGATTMIGTLDMRSNLLDNVSSITFKRSGGVNSMTNLNEITFGRPGSSSFEIIDYQDSNKRITITNTGMVFRRSGGAIKFQIEDTRDRFVSGARTSLFQDINSTDLGLYYIVYNGSRLTDVCLSDGTNCQSLPSDQNLTNVAMLNNTQTFTEANTFTNNVTIRGTLNVTNSSGTLGLFVSENGKVGIGDGVDFTHNLDVHGHVEFEHTADESGDHAFEIDVDAAGFGDVKAIDIVYTTGTMTTGQDEATILINVDESLATGGDVVGLKVISTEGDANIFGLEVGILVNPIEQLSGTFGDALICEVNGVDQTTACNSEASDVGIFTNDDDTVIIANPDKFEEIEFLLDTFSSGGGISPKFEFSTGAGTWTEFNPTDGTNGMRNSGVIVWLNSQIPTWATNGSDYLINITRTRNNLATTPIENKIQIAVATEFFWNKEGEILVDRVNVTTDSCITGGNCLSDISSADFTNIAYLNNTQTFTGINSFNNTIIINGNLTSSDGDIFIPLGNNLTFGGANSCLNWDDPFGFVNNLCYVGAGTTRMSGNTFNMDFDTITFGRGNDEKSKVGFNVEGASALDGSITLQNGSEAFKHNAFYFNKGVFFSTWYGHSLSELLGGNLSWINSGNTLLADVDFIDARGDINATGLICDSTGCIGSGGDTTITNNITTINVSLISITTETNSTLNSNENNVFDEDNHTSYDYTNNTNWIDIIYHKDTGGFEVNQNADYMIDVVLLMEAGSGIIETRGDIRVNGANVYSNIICEPHTVVEPQNCNIRLIKNLNKGDNITVHIESLSSITQQALEGTTFNMWRMSNSITDLKTSWSYARNNDSRAVSTTWITDEWLQHEVKTGVNYTFEFWIHKDGGSTLDDALFNITRPDGFISISVDISGNDYFICEQFGFLGNECDNTPWQITSSDQIYSIKGYFNPVASGTFALAYRENVDVGADFTIERGSYLKIEEVTNAIT